VVAQPTDEPDIPDAVEIKPGEKYVPVSALKAVREELKTLKPAAEKAAQLEAALADARPYVEFLKAHPELLRPQQQPQAPVKEPDPQDDPTLVELAKTLDLYDASTGKPDTTRAAKIRDLTRKEAEAIADQRIAPVTQQTHQQQLQANLQWMANLKDADGRPLEGTFINSTIKAIYGALPEKEALRILADPHVAEVVGYTALGRQAASKKSAPKPPENPPLHVETAGGGTGIVLNDATKKLARSVGLSEQKFIETAKRFKPGQYSPLED